MIKPQATLSCQHRLGRLSEMVVSEDQKRNEADNQWPWLLHRSLRSNHVSTCHSSNRYQCIIVHWQSYRDFSTPWNYRVSSYWRPAMSAVYFTWVGGRVESRQSWIFNALPSAVSDASSMRHILTSPQCSMSNSTHCVQIKGKYRSLALGVTVDAILVGSLRRRDGWFVAPIG